MTRYYIECPLEAALAAKNFGFRFDADWSEGLNKQMGGLSGADYLFFIHMIQSRCLLDIEDIKYYIRPDSLPLLDFKIYDIGLDRKGMPGSFNGVSWVSEDWMHDPVIIIQRNGKPFPQIKQEE